MKFLVSLLASCFLLIGGVASAQDFHDFSFQNERMLVGRDAIFIISSFDSEDHVTAYTFNGQKLWNTRFKSKIVSWNFVDYAIFVFSKAHHGYNTFLTCLDARSGDVVWERP